MEGIDIFISIDSYNIIYPDHSFVIVFLHAFYGFYGKNNLINYKHLIQNADAVFLAPPRSALNEQLIVEAHVNRNPPQRMRRTTNRFFFVSVGYPRIATIQRRLQNMRCELDSLLYAPVSPAFLDSFGGSRVNVLGTYGIDLAGRLLEDFPEYRIVFRPDVHSWENPQTLALIAAHKGHRRFAVSRDFDHVPEYARAATVLTDYSSMGEVFALATLRPELSMMVEAGKQEALITTTGLRVHPSSDISAAVRTLLDPASRNEWRRHIAAAYDRYIVSPEKTFQTITQALLCIAAGRRPARSLSISRNAGRKKWEEKDYITNILLETGIDSELATMFSDDYPEDAAALVLLICLFRNTTPDGIINTSLKEKIKAITKEHVTATIYRDISDEFCLYLLITRKKQALLQKNNAYAEVLDILIKNFPDLRSKGEAAHGWE